MEKPIYVYVYVYERHRFLVAVNTIATKNDKLLAKNEWFQSATRIKSSLIALVTEKLVKSAVQVQFLT